MIVKALELRDRGTFIPLLAIDMQPTLEAGSSAQRAQQYLLRRCGYACDGHPNIAITPMRCDGDKCSNDPHYWGDRTYRVAHEYIITHWNELKNGDVIDVQFILGETATPAISERTTFPL